MIPTRRLLRRLACILCLVQAAAANAGLADRAAATAEVEHVWDGNLYGSRTAPSAGLVDGRLGASFAASRWLRLAADGRLVHLYDNTDLDSRHLRLRVDGAWPVRDGASSLAAGLAGSLRANRDLYSAYDYHDIAAFGSFRHRLQSSTLLELRLDAAEREYPDWSVEDARSAWVQVRAQHSLPTRTSLGLSARAGVKYYLEPANDPTDATLWELSLRVAQSLSPSTGVRAWMTYARAPAHPNAAAQLAAFENPLLDAFATDGTRCGLAVKMKGASAWSIEGSAEYLNLDFPGRPAGVYDVAAGAYAVDDDDNLVLQDVERHDTTVVLRLDATRRLFGDAGATGAEIQAGVAWTTQDSNDLYWVWEDWAGYVGVAMGVGE